MNQPNNRDNMKQKTDFNNWSISYLRDIYQCGKCKKRNTIVYSRVYIRWIHKCNVLERL